MVNSNWYILVRDHPETPKDLLEDGNKKNGVFTEFQVKRAAGLINNLLNYKDLLDTYVPRSHFPCSFLLIVCELAKRYPWI